MLTMKLRAEQKRGVRPLAALVIAAASLPPFNAASHAQAKRPLTREGLVKAYGEVQG